MNFSKIGNKVDNLLNIFFIKYHYKKIHLTVKFREPKYFIAEKDCCIGKNSKIFCWREYKAKNNTQKVNGSVTIGKNFSATRNLTIQACNKVIIGDDVLIASNVFICDYNHGIDDLDGSYLDNELIVSSVEIKNGVWVGQGSYILPGVIIGKNSIVGAGSVVTKSVPDNCMVAGNPAKIIKKYNEFTKKWEKITC